MEEVEEVGGKGEDMVERQDRQCGLFAMLHATSNPILDLGHVRQQVPVREHGAFAHPGGTTGILERRQGGGAEPGGVGGGSNVALTHQGGATGQGLDATRHRYAARRDDPVPILHHIVSDEADEGRKEVGDTHQYHMLNLTLGEHGGELIGKEIDNDQDTGTTVIELVYHLGGGVERVHIDQHTARLERSKGPEWVREAVW